MLRSAGKYFLNFLGFDGVGKDVSFGHRYKARARAPLCKKKRNVPFDFSKGGTETGKEAVTFDSEPPGETPRQGGLGARAAATLQLRCRKRRGLSSSTPRRRGRRASGRFHLIR